MKAASMCLVVIRSKDIDRARLFYETLGLEFTKHQHGKGLEHFASTIGDVIFEIYPLRDSDHPTTSARLGFSVEACDEVTRKLHDAGYIVRSRPNDAAWGRVAVIEDFDGHKVEIVERRT
jgi:catechol 2,3-dioxygenase-like lactoylglutathione lyase family enzyme